jgi:hypothetical protein
MREIDLSFKISSYLMLQDKVILYIFNPWEISYRDMFESSLYDQKFRS